MDAISSEKMTLVGNTLRCLAADEVQKANSGHPGVAMGLADVCAVLWLRHLKIYSGEAKWADRDRFVMSGGHGSSLLYALLHLAQYPISLDDLKQFRQFESITPGHPEYGIVPGVETTTGPLGQGIAAGVGMAIAEKMMAARFNSDGKTLVNHRTWITCGDGDLEEGISHEACSMAGNLKLNNLVLLYDDNRISIEGRVSIAMTDDTRKRFEGYGWKVLECDGHDVEAIDRAMTEAETSDAPVIIICHTTIGKGSPNKADSAGCHGSPLGEEELKLTKAALGFDPEQSFVVPEMVRELFAVRIAEMKQVCEAWHASAAAIFEADTALAAAWDCAMNDRLPALDDHLPTFDVTKTVSTRVASGQVMNALAPAVPWLVGGSADLAPSTMTYLNGMGDISAADFSGRNFRFGIRELGMAAIMNGVANHGGFRIFGSTFFVFSDYCRPAFRVAALMGVPVIYVFTHDSFHVGEDGPTHEPIEQLPSLRMTPDISVIRPADATETAVAWKVALERKNGPTALILSRQNLPVIDRSIYPSASLVEKGAYVLWQRDPSATPDGILIASGSEVELALKVAQADDKYNLRVVSMPSWDRFEAQSDAYRAEVLPPTVKKRMAIEAAAMFGWERYIGAEGITHGMKGFGASAPAGKLAEYFGFTVQNISAMLASYLAQ